MTEKPERFSSVYQDVAEHDERFQYLKRRFDQLLGRKEEKEERLEDLEETRKQLQERLDGTKEARVLVQRVAKETQEKLQYRISNAVSLAQSAVFSDPYDFKVKFVERRNKTEADLVFVKDGVEYGNTLFTAGGGPNDVAAFALRPAFVNLEGGRKILILDEPFRFVNDDPAGDRQLQKKCADMVRMIVDELDFQVVIVTTLPEFLRVADKVFTVSQKNGVSGINV